MESAGLDIIMFNSVPNKVHVVAKQMNTKLELKPT